MRYGMGRLALGFVAAIACAVVAGAAHATDHVSFRLDWKLTGYHVPFYWAKAKGYFAAEGLDVDIKEGAGSGQTINLVGGQQDDIGFADYLLMAAAASKGMGVKAIFGVVQDGAWAVISPAACGSVASTADHKALLDLFMAVNKIPAQSVSVRVTSPATRNTVFAEGQVDGMVSITIGSPMDLVVRANQGKGKPLYFMPFEKFGVAPEGEGLIASDAFIAQKPDVIRRFLRAAARAFAETVDPANLTQAIDIAVKDSGASAERYESVKLQWMDTIKHLHTANTKDKPFGWMSEKDWAATLDILRETGRLEKAVPASQFYTNAFIAQR